MKTPYFSGQGMIGVIISGNTVGLQTNLDQSCKLAKDILYEKSDFPLLSKPILYSSCECPLWVVCGHVCYRPKADTQ